LDKNTRQALFHGVSRKQAGSGDTRDLLDCLNQAGQRQCAFLPGTTQWEGAKGVVESIMPPPRHTSA